MDTNVPTTSQQQKVEEGGFDNAERVKVRFPLHGGSKPYYCVVNFRQKGAHKRQGHTFEHHLLSKINFRMIYDSSPLLCFANKRGKRFQSSNPVCVGGRGDNKQKGSKGKRRISQR